MQNLNTKILSLLLCLVVSLCFIQCEDDAITNPPTGSGVTTPTSGQMITTSFGGEVIDETRNPIAEATVRIGGQTTTTDKNGLFRFNNIEVDGDWANIKVEKEGYFIGSRSLAPTAGSTNSVEIMLLTEEIIGSFSAATGGTVTLASGAKVEIPANGIMDANGNSYTGTVDVAAKYIDPTSDDIGSMVPGSFDATNSDNENVTLESYGMLGVELKTPTGAALQVEEGSMATITIPVPADLQGNAPTTIPLWHFDEEAGIWVEEGEATFNGTEYVGTVGHFSFWNCDAPFPVILCNGKVYYADGSPVKNRRIKICFNNGSCRWGWTDSNGCIRGRFPRGQVLTCYVYNACLNVIWSGQIGPFTTGNTTISDITVNTGASTIITGTVLNCAGQPLNGYALLITGTRRISVYITNGQLYYNLSNCVGNSIVLTCFDPENNQQTIEYTYQTGGTIDLGTIQTCEEGDVTGGDLFITSIVNGVTQNHLFDIHCQVGFNSNFNQYYVNIWVGDFSNTEFNITAYTSADLALGTYKAASIKSHGFFQYGTSETQRDIDVTFTELGSEIGENIAGTFTGTFIDAVSGEEKTISGEFGVQRTQ